ncbi:hypothetical protein FA13DRAFT_1786914 [Coprinellus micaceus]|uniref:Uncharacterized protein n=1 Tax=Coprinellus micaceus TaxID=71717 RepID=A0A4Y7TQQ1_COPMI|nr:hypothetical protein FA13DRAFT_1786914 [Coprinellus micaceus]
MSVRFPNRSPAESRAPDGDSETAEDGGSDDDMPPLEDVDPSHMTMADVMSLAFQLRQVTGSPYFEALLVYLGRRHYGGSESDWAYWLFCRIPGVKQWDNSYMYSPNVLI